MSGHSSTSKNDQKIIIAEGADMTGKTQIAQALSSKLCIPYWKVGREWSAFRGDPVYFRNTVRYGDEYFLSYLKASGASVIKDRGYPSEWVYARAMGRATDDAALWHVDSQYAELGATIVVCYRTSYDLISDDMFPAELGPAKLTEIDGLYSEFASLTQCKVVRLCVDDEDIARELSDIERALAHT